MADDDSTVPLSWIVIFLLMVLGLGTAAIMFVGGSLLAGGGAVAAPLP